MSYRGVFLPLGVLQLDELSVARQVVLARVLSLQDEDDGRGCFAGNGRFRWELALSKSSVQRHVSALVEDHYLERLDTVVDPGGEERTRVERRLYPGPRLRGADLRGVACDLDVLPGDALDPDRWSRLRGASLHGGGPTSAPPGGPTSAPPQGVQHLHPLGKSRGKSSSAVPEGTPGGRTRPRENGDSGPPSPGRSLREYLDPDAREDYDRHRRRGGGDQDPADTTDPDRGDDVRHEDTVQGNHVLQEAAGALDLARTDPRTGRPQLSATDAATADQVDVLRERAADPDLPDVLRERIREALDEGPTEASAYRIIGEANRALARARRDGEEAPGEERRCDCGRRIGPTSELCGSCKRARRAPAGAAP